VSSKRRIRKKRLLHLRLINRLLRSGRNWREFRVTDGWMLVRWRSRAQRRRRRHAPTMPDAGRGDHRARRAANHGPRISVVLDDR